MQVSFYLKRAKAKAETSIFTRITYEGLKVKFYTKEKIDPKFWSNETQRARETAKFTEYPEFNTRLDKIQSDIKTIFRKYRNDNSNEIPQPETLREVLNREINKVQPKNEQAQNFLQFFDSLIKQSTQGTRLHHKTGKHIAPNTLKTYNTTFKHLTNFQDTLKKPIEFESIDLDFYGNYTEYLMNTLKLKANTVGKHIQIIKLLMNEATERGINRNLAHKSKRFVTVREKSESIYLSAEELTEIEKIDLSSNAKLEKVRDLFLIGCYTGLRFSDYSILRPDQIREGLIKTTQIKTGEDVVIPVHAAVLRIMNKYNGNLPAAYSNQKTNEYLKDIGKQVTALKATVSKSFTKGGVKVLENFSKYELLTTHTARRSFATNEFLAGTPALTIMAITGHQTEKAFLKYIKVSKNEHAHLLKKQWEGRNQLKAV